MSKSETQGKEVNKMTVNELIARLQELVAEGRGECKVASDHNYVEEATYNKRLDVVEV